MVRRNLGRTGLSAGVIAFGAFKIGRNEQIKYPAGYDLPDEDAARRLLNAVLDLGIDLIDTAPAYGISEERIGRHLAHRRSEFVLSTKAGETFENGRSIYDFSRAALSASVRRSLARLRTDAVDFLFIHSDGDDLRILDRTDAVETFLELRRQGLARFIGLSAKTPEGARRSLQWADAVMLEYHPQNTAMEPVIAEAAAAGIAVFVKKPLASGRIAPAAAIPFLLKNPGVSTIVVGGLNIDHLRQNIALASPHSNT